jgi:hypothetical protein
MDIEKGDCVKIPDGRIARVRDNVEDIYRVRVRRKTSNTHQFLKFCKEELIKTPCPQGWMSPEGYNRYIKVTLEKIRSRNKEKKSKK